MFSQVATVKALISENSGDPSAINTVQRRQSWGQSVSSNAALAFLGVAVALAMSVIPVLSGLNQTAAKYGVEMIAGGLTGGVVGSGSNSESGDDKIAGGLTGGVVGSGSNSESGDDKIAGTVGEEIPS